MIETAKTSTRVNSMTGDGPLRRVVLVTLASFCLSCPGFAAKTREPAKHDDAKTPAAQVGTQAAPTIVELASAPVVRIEAVDKTLRPIDYRSGEWWLVYLTGALAAITGALAIATFRLYRATVSLGSEAKLTAAAQTNRMERSIAEANRAAVAMENVASATSNNAQLMQSLFMKQMRGYVSVEFGIPVYQDANNLYEVRPVVLNNGLTPAKNLCFRVHIGIFDWNDASTVVQLPPIDPLIVNDIGLAPRASFVIGAILDHRLSDAESAQVFNGAPRRLFAWGKVTYKDVYGEAHETNFCFNYAFFRALDGTASFRGFYYPRHNNTT